MVETGKFFWKNNSAYLLYSADLESGILNIESLDEVGLNFLQSIDVGDKITLLTRNAGLCLLVTELTLTGLRMQCKAIVTQD